MQQDTQGKSHTISTIQKQFLPQCCQNILICVFLSLCNKSVFTYHMEYCCTDTLHCTDTLLPYSLPLKLCLIGTVFDVVLLHCFVFYILLATCSLKHFIVLCILYSVHKIIINLNLGMQELLKNYCICLYVPFILSACGIQTLSFQFSFSKPNESFFFIVKYVSGITVFLCVI